MENSEQGSLVNTQKELRSKPKSPGEKTDKVQREKEEVPPEATEELRKTAFLLMRRNWTSFMDV